MQKRWEMKIFYELNMTSTTKPSKEAQLPPLKEAVETVLFALSFTLTNSLLLVCVFASHQATRGWNTKSGKRANCFVLHCEGEEGNRITYWKNKEDCQGVNLNRTMSQYTEFSLSELEKMAQPTIWKQGGTTKFNFHFKLLSWPI